MSQFLNENKDLPFTFSRQKGEGFTFIETAVVLAILLIVVALSVPVFLHFQRGFDLNNSVDLTMDNLRLARTDTLASTGDDQYGIYFDTSVSPMQYTFFKGDSFLSRDVSFDKVYLLPRIVEIYDLNIGGSEIIFDKMTGTTNNSGSVSLRLTTDNSKTKTIYIEDLGYVDLNPLPTGTDNNRIKDSRHIHFNYSRLINTFVEEIILTFDSGSVVYNISISANLQGGEILWEGAIDVGGETQKISIRTFESIQEFCIYRDRMHNNVSLSITVSGDSSGDLVNYSSDGSVADSSSIYVNDFNWE